METFTISLDTKDSKSKLIICKEKDLFIKVIPEQETFPPDILAISATIGIGKEVYFEVMYPGLDPDYKKWSLELFYEAIEYYCQVELDSEPLGFELINQINFYPYQTGDLIY